MRLFGRKRKKDQESENAEEARAAEIMARLLPTCPVCGADADYAIKLGLLSGDVECRSCRVKWSSPGRDLHGGEAPDVLMLTKPDQEKRARALKGKKHPITYWQHCDVEAYDRSIEREAPRLAVRVLRALSREKDYEQPLEELRALGVNGLLEIIEIALGMGSQQSSDRERQGCLVTLGMVGDEVAEQALIRALEDESKEVRITAVHALVEHHKRTGSYDAVPSLIDVLKNDKSALVRSQTAAYLGDIKGDDRIVEALRQALDDDQTPRESWAWEAGELPATSLAGMISQAVRSGPQVVPTTRDQARRALQELGHEAGYSLEEGVEAFRDGQYDEAIDRLQEVVERGESTERVAQGYKLMGNAYLEKGDREKAIACQKKAIEVDEEDAQAWVNLGVAYRNADRLDDAEDCYKRALDLKPEYPKLYQSLGVLYMVKGEPDQSVEVLEEAVRLAPKMGSAHGNLAFAYARTGQPRKAQSSLARAKELGYENWKTIRKMINALD